MKIRLDVEGTPLTATLDDTEVARDFDSLQPGPLRVTIERTET